MKELIYSFLFALLASCIFNGLVAAVPPYPYKVGINDVKESGFGLRREEGNYPEIQYADGSRASMFMSSIDENGQERNVEFPLGAAN